MLVLVNVKYSGKVYEIHCLSALSDKGIQLDECVCCVFRADSTILKSSSTIYGNKKPWREDHITFDRKSHTENHFSLCGGERLEGSTGIEHH